TTHLETSGARLTAKDLLEFKGHPRAMGLAELMNFPGLLSKEPEVLDKIVAFQDRLIDGHCPTLTGKDLNAYLVCGIHSCHESVTLAETREKLQKGMQVLLREGSVAKNIRELCKILDAYSSPQVSLCTDDRNPVDIRDEGHIDYLIRALIEKGIKPEIAYRTASYSTAKSYGILGKGAIAPGYDADLVVLKDVKKVKIERVFKNGCWIATEKDVPSIEVPPPKENSIRYEIPKLEDLRVLGESGKFRVIEVIPNQIVTKAREFRLTSFGQEVQRDLKNDILKISVLERHGQNRKIATAWVKGFELNKGALAASVAHDSHNVVVVGTNDLDMLECLKWMKESGGGFLAVSDKKILASLSLPVAGLMTDAPALEVYRRLKDLRAASKKLGCKLHEPFLQLAFLCLPVIPELKITDLGLVDVARFSLVDVRV
ncbi:MAG: adenine deaminase C-terminal domain-containing protein, partial [Bdellovibrionota bacterium]